MPKRRRRPVKNPDPADLTWGYRVGATAPPGNVLELLATLLLALARRELAEGENVEGNGEVASDRDRPPPAGS
jgi:hypothetical protein